jgi:hypothetical protein
VRSAVVFAAAIGVLAMACARPPPSTEPTPSPGSDTSDTGTRPASNEELFAQVRGYQACSGGITLDAAVASYARSAGADEAPRARYSNLGGRDTVIFTYVGSRADVYQVVFTYRPATGEVLGEDSRAREILGAMRSTCERAS